MNIYWDRQNLKLYSDLSGSRLIGVVSRALRDIFPITIAILTPQASLAAPYVAGALDAGQAIAFGLKKTEDDPDYLASLFEWTKSGDGTTTRYTGTVNLNTVPLISAVTASPTSFLGEFTIVNADGSQQDSTRLSLSIYKDIIRGETPPPTLAGVGFAVEYYTAPSGAEAVRIRDRNGRVLETIFAPGEHE